MSADESRVLGDVSICPDRGSEKIRDGAKSKNRYRSKRWTQCIDCQEMFKRPRGARKIWCPECADLRRDAQSLAHSRVHTAVRQGLLPHHSTLTCVDCGAGAAGFEHRDYSKPLEVVPICAKCNSARGSAALPLWLIERGEL